MKLDPFRLFQIYHGIHLHYTSDYDYQKYNGKTLYKESTFNTNKNKYSFHKLAKIFEYNDYNYFEYYVSWYFFKRDGWVTPRDLQDDILTFETHWKEYSRNRITCFWGDMSVVTTLNLTRLIEQAYRKELYFPTILILDYFRDIIDIPQKPNFLVENVQKKLQKFRPFYLKHEPQLTDTFEQYIPEIIDNEHV